MSSWRSLLLFHRMSWRSVMSFGRIHRRHADASLRGNGADDFDSPSAYGLPGRLSCEVWTILMGPIYKIR
jgi:hypothetical protein